ncbi:MAG: RNA-binding transcriptional accessory protein, partial [Prevotella sp.]|nr:RNA-binding transcriptional accessory protein [Prevotella sp.]
MNIFTQKIAAALRLPEKSVDNTLVLLSEGCTIPFIARYRKEKTGGLDEVQIAQIADMSEKLQELVKRKETIIKTITEQQKMTPELLRQINDCWESTTLEDL